MGLDCLKSSGVVIAHFSYRGKEVDLYEDLRGKQLLAIVDDELYELGKNNTIYERDLKLIINEKLDTLSRFEEIPDFYGAKLERFQNGSFSDIRLSYRGRILKIWLDQEEDLFQIIAESKELLRPHVKRYKDTLCKI